MVVLRESLLQPCTSRGCSPDAERYLELTGRTRRRQPIQLALVGLVLAFALPAPASAQDLKPVSSAIAARIDGVGRRAVAVADFTDLPGNVNELGRYLAEELSVALVMDAKLFSVIDRTHLKTLLREHKLASTGLIDPQTARQLGKIAGVDTLVTGTWTAFGEAVRLTVKALDTESARILAATTYEIARTERIKEMEKTSSELVLTIGGASAVSSGPAPAARRATGAGTFANDVIAVSARSAGISHARSQWNASIAIAIENISQEDQFLAYAANSALLSDQQARTWSVSSVSGLPFANSNPPARAEFARLPVGGKQTVIVTFLAFADEETPKPAEVAVSMMAWRLRGTAAERMSIGLTEIPVAK